MRIATDTGGTFTDLVVEDGDEIRMFKAPTTPADPIDGVLAAVAAAAAGHGVTTRELLSRVSMFMHGTTRAINAILTHSTARTAFLTTAGHADMLVIREGGRNEPFNFRVDYPEPYVPRALTFEVAERTEASGRIRTALDEDGLRATIAGLKALDIEAVGVCFLWSIVNPRHETRVGELLEELLPGVPYTLSHRLNPTLREYRRASATCIDASLKPLMFTYLDSLGRRLRDAGLRSEPLIVTSQGGLMEAADVAQAPIHVINSGPSMAPVAGRRFAARDAMSDVAVVADTGGTSYDVSVVRHGRIPWTRDTWLGPRFRGHMTGFPSVDIKSIGAGGGSIAWVDGGGLLHVGPRSAGSVPGPACYGAGGTRPTVTDSAVALGWIDAGLFMNGAMTLDRGAAERALAEHVGRPLGLTTEAAAAAVMALATETMVAAIEDVTVKQGIDPAAAVLIGGGGAGGLNAAAVGRRLGCQAVLIPETGAALSAVGALMSDLLAEHAQVRFCSTRAFDYEGVNAVLAVLRAKCEAFAARCAHLSSETTIELAAEAHYEQQIWEIEIPIEGQRIDGPADLAVLVEAFHRLHLRLFEVDDRTSPIEFINWHARVRCRLPASEARMAPGAGRPPEGRTRQAYFQNGGWRDVPVVPLESMAATVALTGPAMIESAFTTIVIDPDATAVRTAEGGLLVRFLPSMIGSMGA